MAECFLDSGMRRKDEFIEKHYEDCFMSAIVEKGKLVSITYRILDEKGGVVEQSDIPIDYVHGQDDRMFPKVLEALEGKTMGDEIRVMLTAEEGFGLPDPNLIIVDDIENAPPEFQVIGARPTFQNEHGETMEMVVTKIEDGKITVDGNHPFAGKAVTFLLNVMSVRDPADVEDVQEIIASEGPTTLQ